MTEKNDWDAYVKPQRNQTKFHNANRNSIENSAHLNHDCRRLKESNLKLYYVEQIKNPLVKTIRSTGEFQS